MCGLAATTLLAGCGLPPGNNGNSTDNHNANSPIGRTCNQGGPLLPATVSYANDIFPIFDGAGCLTSACHGGLNDSQYFMTTYAELFRSGLQAEVFGLCTIEPGNPNASYLIEKLYPRPRSGVQMPNENRDPLTIDQINLIRTWIAEGAADN